MAFIQNARFLIKQTKLDWNGKILLCFLHEGLQHSCFKAAQMKTNGHNRRNEIKTLNKVALNGIMIEPFPVVQTDLPPVLLHSHPQHHRRRLADLICVGARGGKQGLTVAASLVSGGIR